MDEKREVARLFGITLALGAGSVLLLVVIPFLLFSSPIEALSTAGLFIAAASLYVMATPFCFLILIHCFGCETPEVVPDHLSFLPNRARKPWEVNLIFRDEPLDFDDNGFFATVLDLNRRGFIRIEPAGQAPGLHICILKRESPDRYEDRILTFLAHKTSFFISPGSVYNTVIDLYYDFRRALVPDRREAIRYLVNGRTRVLPWFVVASFLYVTGLVLTPLADQNTIQVFPDIVLGIALAGTAILGLIVFTHFLMKDLWVERRTVHFVAMEILSIAMLTLIGSFVFPFTRITMVSAAVLVLPFIALLQTLLALASSPTLFGQWRRGMYREKLQWDAFRRYLTDFTSLKGTEPEEVGTWGEWLVYGTALGVGERVTQSMRRLSISSRETDDLVSLLEERASLQKRDSKNQ
jgi:hypothetical protein